MFDQFMNWAVSKAYAQDTVPSVSPTAGSDASGQEPDAFTQFLMTFGPLILIMVLFWLLLIRPQSKRMKEHQNMLGNLQKGDKVVTSGGLVGTIHKLEGEDKVVLDLGDNMRVTAMKAMITQKLEG